MDMRFGVGNIFSPVILFVSIMIITMVPKKVKREVLPTLKYYYYFISFYIVYGALIAYAQGIAIDQLYFLVKSNVSSIIVVTAAAFGFVNYARNINSSNPLIYLHALAMLSIGSIYYGRFDSSIYRHVRYEDLYESRFSGFFANPNEAGMAACAATAFCLFYIAKGSKVTINFSLLVLSGIAVFLTFSRSALIVYVLLVLTYLFFLLLTKEKKILGFTIVLLGGLFVTYMSGAVLKNQNWDRTQQLRINSMLDIASSGEITQKQTQRIKILRIAASMIAESPLAGHGLGALHKMTKANGLGSHNSFLVIQGEAGILGSLLFTLFLFLVVRKTLRIEDLVLRRLVFSYMFVFLSMMFFTHNGLTNRNHNFYLGSMLAVISIAEKQNKTEKRLSVKALRGS